MIADELCGRASTRSTSTRALWLFTRACVRAAMLRVHVQRPNRLAALAIALRRLPAAGTEGAFGRREIREWPFAGVSHSP